jgi:hypothetical protein
MIVCENCRAAVEDGMIFCTSCGTRLPVDDSATVVRPDVVVVDEPASARKGIGPAGLAIAAVLIAGFVGLGAFLMLGTRDTPALENYSEVNNIANSNRAMAVSSTPQPSPREKDDTAKKDIDPKPTREGEVASDTEVAPRRQGSNSNTEVPAEESAAMDDPPVPEPTRPAREAASKDRQRRVKGYNYVCGDGSRGWVPADRMLDICGGRGGLERITEDN